jgi:hypothetical protein
MIWNRHYKKPSLESGVRRLDLRRLLNSRLLTPDLKNTKTEYHAHTALPAPIACCLLISCSNKKYDTIIRNGIVYDGNGGAPFVADVAIKNDTIAFIGDLSKESAKNEVDAKGMAVTPGFINMLSWSPVTLIEDGRSQGEIREGVTLEVFGEGESMGPLNAK